MVRDERGEPARPLAAVVARSPTWAGAAAWTLTLTRAVRPAAPRRLADLADEPADEVGIGELQDHAVGDPSGHREGHRPVAGDPDRQRPAAPSTGSWSSVPSYVDGRPATSSRMTRIASSSVAIVVGGLPSTRRAESPRPMPRSIRPPLTARRATASADAVTRRLAGRRVRDAGPEPQPLGRLGHERQEGIGVAPQDVGVEQPAVVEAGRLGLARRARASARSCGPA